MAHRWQYLPAWQVALVSTDSVGEAIRYVHLFTVKYYHCLNATSSGPIYSLNLGGQTLVVLNNHKVASDLLDKRSAIYADRPRMIVTGELLCGGFFFAFNSCNEL